MGSPSLAMDWSSKVVSYWKNAMRDRDKRVKKIGSSVHEELQRWRPPEEGHFKVNVDA